MSTVTDDRIGPLGMLTGTWSGQGSGTYPTIEPFEYGEEVTFTDPGVKPFLAYVQRTKSPAGAPLHAECGYLRWSQGAPEWVIAQPSGIAEVHRGTASVDGDRLTISFESVAVALAPTAKQVSRVARTLTVEGDELRYELHMAAVGEPHQFHLRATLFRLTP